MIVGRTCNFLCVIRSTRSSRIPGSIADETAVPLLASGHNDIPLAREWHSRGRGLGALGCSLGRLIVRALRWVVNAPGRAVGLLAICNSLARDLVEDYLRS